MLIDCLAEEFSYRLPNEPRAAYLAFTGFRDGGPGRTLDKAFRVFAARGGPANAEQKSGPLPDYFFQWARDWVWEERAHAFDRNTARLERIDRETAKRERERQRWERELHLEGLVHKQLLLLNARMDEYLSGDFARVTVKETGSKGVVETQNDRLATLTALLKIDRQLVDIAGRLAGLGPPPFISPWAPFLQGR